MGGCDGGFEAHAVGDLVEAGEAGGGSTAVPVIEDALQVSDDGERVIEFENTGLDGDGIESGEGERRGERCRRAR